MTTKEDDQMMEVDDGATQECCPICYTEYQTTSGTEYARIVCSGRCKTFSMCRLCVYRQSTYLSNPFVVDDTTGDFTTLDPTKCPQCNESGAFNECDLIPLSDAIMASEEEEHRKRNEEFAEAAVTRALSRLNEAPHVLNEEECSDSMVMENQFRRIGGPDAVAIRPDGILVFGEQAIYMPDSIGLPHLFSRSGITYFELNVRIQGFNPYASVGFSAADGMEEGVVGDTMKSWGIHCFNRGIKIHNGNKFGSSVSPRWGSSDTIGVAVNIEKGMIAVSTNGNWEFAGGNGIIFEDERIKRGVFPVLSAMSCCLNWRFRPDELQFGPPPDTVWEIWPKYEDVGWVSLPIEAREAAMTLGYTQNIWMNDGDNPTEEKKWNELSREEQAAASVLGYNEEIWEHITSTSDDDSEDDNDSYYEETFFDVSWDELPDDAKLAAQTLGFTSSTWDDAGANPVMEKEWGELSDEQQRAAILLGYDENLWEGNEEGDDNSFSGASDLPFEDLAWADLPRSAKEAAIKLGYTQQVWDEDLDGPLDLTRFDDLTEEQKFACAALGYTKTTWDYSVNRRLFGGMGMSDAFQAMQAISFIMARHGPRR